MKKKKVNNSYEKLSNDKESYALFGTFFVSNAFFQLSFSVA